MDNLKEFAKPNMGDMSLMSFVKARPTWEQNSNYGRLIAALDMFVSKFPECEYARVRVCTVSARFKDCAALTGVEYLRGLLEIPFDELMAWIWTASVAKDLRQVFRKGEELTKPDSYLPYLASMKLVAKSPYSASHNTSLHFWIHFTAALMGQTRSNHARFMGGTNTVDPLFNAQFLAYAKHSRTATRIQFRQKEDVHRLKKASGVFSDQPEGEESADNNPLSWYRFAQMYSGRIPQAIQATNAARANQLADVRKDTIGAHLREWAKASYNQV